MTYRILLADDNAPYTLLCMEEFLKDPRGIKVDTALSPGECLEKLRTTAYHLVILDIDFGHGVVDGLSLIPEIRGCYPNIGILMHSNSNESDTVIRARRLGADDFAAKGHSLEELAIRVRALLARGDANAHFEAEAIELAKNAQAAFKSVSMHKIYATVARLRQAPNLNVLIRGETGTGKELIAKALSRKDQGLPFITVNCAAISPNLIESVLFGHVRGAFTGAIRDHKGKFEEANGGDIFLDEVACLPLTAQAALLRVLEQKESERVGSSSVKRLTFRVIAATNENIEELIAAGKFRQDLFQRLNGLSIKMPPLAERREDIMPIVRKILEQEDRPNLRIVKDCQDILEKMPWPDNVRQLKQTVLAMLTTVTGDILTLADMPLNLLPEPKDTPNACKSHLKGDSIFVEIPINNVAFDDVSDAILRRMIEAKTKQLGEDVSQVKIAESLNISRSTFQRFVKRTADKFDLRL